MPAFDAATLLVRRLLRECEGKLDPSLFFHARRDCIVNLAHVSQIRTLEFRSSLSSCSRTVERLLLHGSIASSSEDREP